MLKFHESIKKSGISSSDQEKIMCNFHWSWYFVSEFPRCTTQLCGTSKGEVLFSLEFPWVSDKWGIPEKNQTGRGGVSGNGISKDIKEITCGISWG